LFGPERARHLALCANTNGGVVGARTPAPAALLLSPVRQLPRGARGDDCYERIGALSTRRPWTARIGDLLCSRTTRGRATKESRSPARRRSHCRSGTIAGTSPAPGGGPPQVLGIVPTEKSRHDGRRVPQPRADAAVWRRGRDCPSSPDAVAASYWQPAGANNGSAGRLPLTRDWGRLARGRPDARAVLANSTPSDARWTSASPGARAAGLSGSTSACDRSSPATRRGAAPVLARCRCGRGAGQTPALVRTRYSAPAAEGFSARSVRALWCGSSRATDSPA
jgi:hypothetical protein